ncbi:MAG: M12 family metallo-peptidase [Ferruginibacter sp.]
MKPIDAGYTRQYKLQPQQQKQNSSNNTLIVNLKAMSRYITLVKRNLVFILPFLFTSNAIAQKVVSASLFSIDLSKPGFDKIVRKRTTLSISYREINRILVSKPTQLELEIPFEGKILSMQLERYYPLSKAFQVTISTPTGNSEWYPYEEGLFFRGTVKNQNKSFAAVSFFNGEFAGVISDEKSNIAIGAVKQNGLPSNDYIIYRSTDAIVPFILNCATDDANNIPAPQHRPLQANTTTTIGCPVDVYVEADHALYLANGSNVSNTVNFVATVMNGVSVVYLNENISLQLREVKVWTTADPYVGLSDAKPILKAFEINMAIGYNGDVAQLLSSRKMNSNVTGIAPVDVLCKPNPGDRCSFVSSLNATNPTSDINTYLAAHELGHNFGSLHTQNCSWVGGALDNCVAPEGTCAPGPAPVNGGTIMSYCTVNLANGFGKQPGDLIRAKLLGATCVCNCNNMEVSATSGSVICSSNGSAVATVSGLTGAAKFLWDNGETNATATRLTAGWHYVTVTSQNTAACKIIKGVKVAGTIGQAPAIPTITNVNNTLVSSAQSGNQWFLNGAAIIGATSKSYQPGIDGDYAVLVTVNGCSSISVPFHFSSQPRPNTDIKIFPNPVSQNLTINNNSNKPLLIQLVNMLGQTLFTSITSNANVTIDMRRYSAGAYILAITNSDTDEKIKKILIKE